MAKHATLKDILYATQFNGERLVLVHPEPPKMKARWRLSKTNIEVEPDVAEKFRTTAGCVELAKDQYGFAP